MFGPRPELLRAGRDLGFSEEAAQFLIHENLTPSQVIFEHTFDAEEGLFYIGYGGIKERIICNPLQWADIIIELQKYYHPEWFPQQKDIIQLEVK